MNKIIVVHIHTDYKFINNFKIFEGAQFLNTNILIKGSTPYTLENSDNLILLTSQKQDLQKIVNHCKNVHIVVLYDLDYVKCRIALSIPNNIIIIWRFFGYELYGKRRDLFLSDLSKTVDVQKPSVLDLVKGFLRPAYNLIRYQKNSNDPFFQAAARINHFLGLCDEEYEFLKTLWIDLPKFLKLPHSLTEEVKYSFNVSTKDTVAPVIIIGNNRSSYNNHFDLINLIEKYETKSNYSFQLLFNYGIQNNYTKEVIKEISNKKHFLVHNKFMDKDTFNSFYENATALVIDGYRQMAVGNIYLAFKKGLKIYLNNKNIYKKFLENQGFKILNIDDFENDLKNDNLIFDREMAQYNFDNFKLFAERYTIEDFQQKIHSMVEKE